MKRIQQLALIVIVVSIGALAVARAGGGVEASMAQTNPAPNVIYIMADDLGYGDLGCYGQKLIQTPNLDRLAKEGMRFTQMYAGSTVCAPSRAVLMTGRHLGRVSVRGNAGRENIGIQALRKGERTVAKVFKDAGYATALFGKWGLGEIGSDGHPNRMGFDEFFGFLSQTHAHNYYPSWLIHNDEKYPLRNEPEVEHEESGAGWARKKVDYAPDVIFDKAMQWLDQNKSKPFFLYFATTLPHANNEASRATGDGQEVPDYGVYKDKPWPNPDKGQAAMITRLDAQVGRILEKLKESGIDRRTLVIFTSDNGPHEEGKNNPQLFHPAGPLRGMKRALYEGGVRVPFIARWPGKIKAGSTSDHIGYFGDVLATVSELTKQKSPAGLNSISFLPTLLRQPAKQRQHKYIYFEFYEQGGRQSARFGNWKAIREPMFTGRMQLYDLSKDPGETKNLAESHPEIVKRAATFMDEAHVDDPLWQVRGQSANVRQSAPPAKKPNILILYADDWRHDTLGAAGNPVVKTPNLDRLATEGVRFRRAYVTTSICGVSRASLFTGQWMSRHGNRAFDAFKTPWAETYPGVLRANGYWVGHIGKWHNGKFPAEQFDFGRSYAGTHYQKQPDGSTIHVTQKNERDALEFLRARPAGKPFCLTLAFFATHAEDQNPKQYLPQPQSEALYRDATIPVPQTMSDEYFKRLPPFIANEKNEGRNRWHWRFDTPEKYQQYMKDYYRLATEVDATVGRVLAELKAQGLHDDTLVIFTTDNGYFHGEHGLADKWYPYEESIRTPLIVRDPRMKPDRRGGVNDEIVLNTDLAPTILAFAGLAAPAGMQGRDFAPLYLAARRPTWRKEFFYEHAIIRHVDFIPASEALVRKEIKYILWPDFGYEELFDLRRDPSEVHNLVKDKSYAAKLAQMRERFAELKAFK